MSHPARSRTVLRIVATLAAASLLAACGFKGPLYLPPAEGQSASGARTAPQPPTQPGIRNSPQLPSPSTLP